jgi:hypothetical protein
MDENIPHTIQQLRLLSFLLSLQHLNQCDVYKPLGHYNTTISTTVYVATMDTEVTCHTVRWYLSVRTSFHWSHLSRCADVLMMRTVHHFLRSFGYFD